jgi:putative two-component system response regulator
MEIRFVPSISSARDELGKTDFVAVFADEILTEPDGYEFLNFLANSRQTKTVPIIVLADWEDHAIKRQALKLGVTDILSKPVCPEEFYARLNSVLRLHTYQREQKKQVYTFKKELQARTAELEESRLDIILRLGKAAEYRNEETGNHIVRVGCYSRAIAQELKMSQEFAEMMFFASPLHDIGKIGIPDSVLLKQDRFTGAERKIMEQHCVIGEEILLQEPTGLKPFLRWHRDRLIHHTFVNPVLKMAADIVVAHHEKWDGSGYPRKLKGEDIPLVARIVALADVYDALRTRRPYKPAYSEAKAITIMEQVSSSHFDPVIFSAFKNVLEIFNAIHTELTDDIEQDEIVELNL